MYANLYIAMKTRKPRVTQKNIANEIGITPRQAFNKINNGKFYDDEALKIQGKYFPDYDLKELFKKV